MSRFATKGQRCYGSTSALSEPIFATCINELEERGRDSRSYLGYDYRRLSRELRIKMAIGKRGKSADTNNGGTLGFEGSCKAAADRN